MMVQPQRQAMKFGMVLGLAACFCGEAWQPGGIVSVARAQVVIRRPVWYHAPWGRYDPYRWLTSRVYAQAELIRANADAARTYAEARNLHAEAYDKELDNWIKELRTYWDRRLLAEKKRLEMAHVRQIKKMRYLNDQKWQNNRVWDRLKNHPELSETSIRNGKALNFLLDRLAASALPYDYRQDSGLFADEALQELVLTKELLGDVMLRQGQYVFAANQTAQDKISQWPYLLRWADFDQERTAFEDARARVMQASAATGAPPVPLVEYLQECLVRLTLKYHQSAKIKEWVQANRRFSHFYASDRFLQQLDREIRGLQTTGDLRPLQGRSGYAPEVDGDHIVGLLCYMNRNGIEFAPPQPGKEYAYNNMFVMMRAVYLTVADLDASTRPEDLSRRIEAVN